jgi:anti-anti-sigma factor
MTLIESTSTHTLRQPPPSAGPGLTVRTAHQQGIFVIAPYGELDMATTADVQRELDRAERSDAGEIVLDLSGLTFIDSTGIRLVLHAHQRSRADGNRLKLIPGRDQVHGVFRLCGLTERLPFLA